jgi:cytochrome c
MRALLLFAMLHATAFAADESAARGRKVFESRCAGCHQGATPGPNLTGVVGRKAGAGKTGVHSRALAESGIVWSRDSLRRFLADPGREVPGTIMPVRVGDAQQLEDLLDYLETLH